MTRRDAPAGGSREVEAGYGPARDGTLGASRSAIGTARLRRGSRVSENTLVWMVVWRTELADLQLMDRR